MIIKDDNKKSYFPLFIKTLGLIGVLVLIVYLSIRPTSISSYSGKHRYICDMENKTEGQFVTNHLKFDNAKTQSSEKYRSGKHASLINNKHKYGVGFLLKNIEKGDHICVDVWRWSAKNGYGFLAAQGNKGSDFIIQSNIAEETDSEGWDRINLCFDVPENNALSEIKIFVYSLDDKGHAYFDDLDIRIVKASERNAIIASFDVPHVQLYINSKGWKELEAARSEAQRYGILINNRGYIKAMLGKNDDSQEVSLRLKGDWNDHLEGNRWSYRIKTKKDKSWNRMQTFSFQSPERRFYVKEWLFHDFLSKQDILAPKYDFFWLKINDQSPLLYAYEEHFDKHLPESKNRKEGVIVKYTEDAAWEQRLRSKKALGHHNGYLVEAKYHSDIAPFKSSRIEGDSVLLKQFIEAQELMYAYKHYLKPVDQIFDIDRFAKFYASLEVLNAYHSLVWHNQRFYYNPITRLLEPIAYDGFIEESEYNINSYICFAYYKSHKDVTEWGRYYNALYRNKSFARKFAFYLDQFSNPQFLKSYLTNVQVELDKRVELIKTDFPDYSFNNKKIFAKAKEISASLPLYNNISLKAFTDHKNSDSLYLSVSNYNHLPVEIIGSGLEASNSPHSMVLKTKVLWSNHPKKAPEYSSYTVPKSHKYIYYQVLGLKDVFYSRIYKWPSGHNIFNRDLAIKKDQIPFNKEDIYISDTDIIIRTGHYVLVEPLIIREGKNLIIEAGTIIDLKNKAYIYTSGSVTMIGTDDQPIKIISSDQKGQGLFVIKAKEKSIIKNVFFEHLNNIDQGNWSIPGAVTFYESKVDIYKCTFSKIHCEDALNIVRSDFVIDRMYIVDAYSDGFDADFSAGKVSNSSCNNTGNDGFDFSGSIVEIDRCRFTNIGDKGISAGEQATITIIEAQIDSAVMGVASKDLSLVTIKNISITNCNKAFVAYQKKPEYGPAKIIIENYHASNNKYLQIQEDASLIIFKESQ